MGSNLSGRKMPYWHYAIRSLAIEHLTLGPDGETAGKKIESMKYSRRFCWAREVFGLFLLVDNDKP
jgi:hypothetical protein